jgi:hypothetical protein
MTRNEEECQEINLCQPSIWWERIPSTGQPSP